MDPWGWALEPWLPPRTLPPGPLFCVIEGATRGAPWAPGAAGLPLRPPLRRPVFAAVRAPSAPPRSRYRALARRRPAPVIQRQLGHSHLSTTVAYLQGINTEEIITTIHARRAPMMHAGAGLALQSTTWERGARSCNPGQKSARYQTLEHRA